MIASAMIIERSASLTDRKHAQIMKATLVEIAEHHRYVTMGDHFKINSKTAPGGEYGYRKRVAKYKKTRPLPNVFTGTLRRRVKNNSRITKTQHRATLKIRPGFRMPRWQSDELKATTRGESADAAKLGHKTYLRHANNPANQRKRRRRVS